MHSAKVQLIGQQRWLVLKTTGNAFNGVCLVLDQLLSDGGVPLWVVEGVWLLWSDWGSGGERERRSWEHNRAMFLSFRAHTERLHNCSK